MISHFNPGGFTITNFKAPTTEEARHDFLWRIRRALPKPGYVAIFNRSQYEDVLITRVKNLVASNVVERRYGLINAFESELVSSGTAIVKICLHISYEEQRAPLLERLDDPAKRWKFSAHDLIERGHWGRVSGRLRARPSRAALQGSLVRRTREREVVSGLGGDADSA